MLVVVVAAVARAAVLAVAGSGLVAFVAGCVPALAVVVELVLLLQPLHFAVVAVVVQFAWVCCAQAVLPLRRGTIPRPG